jgi:uncharacterized membrane protein YbhN (UPF0104 family)
MVVGGTTLGDVRKLLDLSLVRRWLPLALLMLLTAVALWRVDLAESLSLLGDIEVAWAAAGLGLFGLSKLTHAMRWKVLMQPFASPRTGETVKLFLLGNLVNGLLPLRAGDIVRVQMAARRLHVPRAQMTSSVFVVETLFDGLAFIALLCCAAALSDVPGLTRGLLIGLAASCVGACVAAALLANRSEAIGGWLSDRAFPGSEAAGGVLGGILDGLRPFADRTTFAAGFVLGCVGWALEAGAYAALGESFGLGLEAVDYLVVMIAANLLTALPLTPMGFGVYELGLQELVHAFGPTTEEAFAYVLGCHLLFSAWIVVGGFVSGWTLPLRGEEVLYLRGEGVASVSPFSAGGRR